MATGRWTWLSRATRTRLWLTAVLPSILLLATGCATRSGSSASTQGAASNEYWFDSLAVMAATSDVVVLGTVVDVRDGTKIGPPGEEIEHLDAVIKVSEALYGSIGADSLTVQTLKFVAPEVDWRKSGGTVLAFLKLSADPVDGGRFYPVNDQSVFLVTDADVRATILEDPFSERVAAMTLEEIRRELADAAEAISAGEVAPQSPAGG